MERDKFSRFGALVVIAGSAVGLGNIWRFPYMVATNGGAAFILLYIFFVLIICLPVMVAELSIGRRSRCNAYRALDKLSSAPAAKAAGRGFGLMYVLIPTLILSYYCVIGGSTVDYFLRACGITAHGGNGMQLLWTLIFLLLTAAVVAGGVKGGIEKFSKIMMPLLFIIVLLIALRSATLPATGSGWTARDGLDFMFRPDFSKLGFKSCLAALGQAFFSLSIGSGVLMTYGSYVNPKDKLFKTAGEIAFFDLLFAIIAGCAVIPAVFALEADPVNVLANNTDSRLVFNILPEVFPAMPLGKLIGAVFFFSLILAALTSSISQMEVPVSYLTEEKKLSRPLAVALVFAVAIAIGSACTLRGQVLNALDALCANWLMPLGGIAATVFVGWIMGFDELHDELSSRGLHKTGKLSSRIIHLLIRYIAPIGVLSVFLTQFFNLL